MRAPALSIGSVVLGPNKMVPGKVLCEDLVFISAVGIAGATPGLLTLSGTGAGRNREPRISLLPQLITAFLSEAFKLGFILFLLLRSVT